MADRIERSRRRAVLAILCLLCLPWTVVVVGPAVTLVFGWGLANPETFNVVPLTTYLAKTSGLPSYLLAWPLSVGLYLLALASAAVGAATGREDVRVTAGLLVLTGAAQVSVAYGLALQPDRTAWPVGTLLLWTLAWWFYWPAIRRTVALRRTS